MGSCYWYATFPIKIGLADEVGADGVHSPVRNSLIPTGTSLKLPWSVVNIHLPPTLKEKGMEQFLKDSNGDGLEFVVGKGWTATFLPVSHSTGEIYIALTLPSPSPIEDPIASIKARAETHFIDTLIHQIEHHAGDVKMGVYPIYSASNSVVGRGKVVLIGDASHVMTPFVGAGASCGIVDGFKLAEVVVSECLLW